MIILSHVSGMPADLIEHVLRNFTVEYEYEKNNEELDGNMYRFFRPDTKILHGEDIIPAFEKHKNSDQIFQIQYPSERVHADEIIKIIEDNKNDSDKHVFIACEDLRSAEFVYVRYYRQIGTTAWHGLDQVFVDCTENAHYWNPEYNDYALMQNWELRECFSLCYPGIAREWIDAKNYVPATAIKINLMDLFFKPVEVFKQLIIDCGLTLSSEENMINYLQEWQSKQTQELKEMQLIDMIISSTLNDQFFDWEDPDTQNKGPFEKVNGIFSIIGEAITQQRLRSNGYEIRCAELNEFPTNSRVLRSLLDPVQAV